MKIKIIALVAGMALSAIAGAGTFENTVDNKGVNLVSSGADGACALLREEVRVALSAEVQGGYECDTDTNVIAVSMCHPNGRKNSSGNNFFYTVSTAGGKIRAVQDAACTQDGGASAAEGKATALAAETPSGGGDDGDDPPPAD